MSVQREYLRTLVAQVGGSAVAMGGSFLAFVLLARVLGSEIFGQYAFVMAFVMTAGTLADLGTNAMMARGIAVERDRDPGAFLGSFLVVRAVLAGAVVLAAVPVALVIKPEIRDALLVGCALIPLAAARFFQPVYQVFGRARYSFYAFATLGVSRIVLAAVLLLVVGVGLTGFVAGALAAQLLYLVVGLGLAVRLVRPRLGAHASQVRAIAAIAAPIGVAEIFNAVYARADVIMLTYLRGSVDAGHYNAAYRLLDIAVVAAATAATPLVPILTRLLREDRESARRACARLTELVFVLALPAPMVIGYLGPPLVIAVYGEQFAPSAAVLPAFAWLFLLSIWFMLGSSINLATGQVSHGYWSSAVTAVLNIALNFLLIPRYGIVGAAWATVASIVFKLVVSQFYAVASLGNLYRAGRCVRIAAAAGLLQICLHLMVGEHLVVPVVVSLAAYALAVRGLGLADVSELAGVRGGRARAAG